MAAWFEEQLRARIHADEEAFSNAFSDITEAVSGERINEELKENEIANAANAIEEIARFYDIPEDFLRKIEVREDDTLSDRLENIFGPHGVMRRYVELKGDWYKDASGVYLGTAKDGRYVALMPSGRGYYYKDHSTGKRVRINSSTKDTLNTGAICFYNPMPARRLSIMDLMKFAAKSLSFSDIAYIAMITLFIALFSMAAPFMTRIIYSQVIYSHDMSSLTAIFVFIVLSGISAALLQIARALVISRIEIKANVSVSAGVMMRMLTLPALFFKSFSSGELSQRAASVTMLCTSIVNVVFSVGLTAFISLIYLRQIFSFAPVLVMPALWIMAALFVSSLLLIHGHSWILKQRMKLSAEEYGLIYAFITGIQKIKLAGAERRAFAKWASHYKHEAKLEYDPPLFLKLTPVIQPAITLVGTFVLYLEAYNAGTAPEDYMAFMASYSLLSGAFIAFCEVTLTAAMIGPMMSMIRPVLEAVPEISHGRILSAVRGGVELNRVSFRYSSKTPFILDNLSLKIRPGEYVAIVGKSGCGKSTLMRLLLGFETPSSGVVYYDGIDIKTLDLRYLRSRVGCVMQNSGLFPGSIYSNITISAPQITEEEVWEAAEMAGIADDIRKMPMGMNTMISEGAGTISGGQRQRIIIARAVAPKPKILLFDEATSALDNITQKIVSDSLDRLKCTRIVIAHRLSTVRHCGRILVLDSGHIAEEGTYDELIARKGLFAALVERQKLGEVL